MEHVKEYKLKRGKILRVFQDESPANPRLEWDNLFTMVAHHTRYNLGDKEPGVSKDDFESWADMETWMKKNTVVYAPLYLFDHSGITIKTTPFNDGWDSGQVGFIFITKKQLVKENMEPKEDETDEEFEERLKSYMLGEVETYDQYLRGEVYGFKLIQEDKCPSCEHIHETELDSCWGFFGDNIKENGILDHIDNEDIPEELEAK